ncbi:MAG: PepSY domain-containing protein [Acidobacteriia bacterium]|nr:PepSY domain-containing protein [Terriglobia bacterium]
MTHRFVRGVMTALFILAVFVAGLNIARAQSAKTKKDAALASQAKITMDQAREIALKKAPGTVASGELEKEKGKLIYSFDIKTSEKEITEVNVDAITGKVLSVEKEDAAKEAAEAKKEARTKSKTAPNK